MEVELTMSRLYPIFEVYVSLYEKDVAKDYYLTSEKGGTVYPFLLPLPSSTFRPQVLITAYPLSSDSMRVWYGVMPADFDVNNTIDGYLAIKTPDGALYFILAGGKLSSMPAPLVSAYLEGSDSGIACRAGGLGNMPHGEYTVFSVLCAQGAGVRDSRNWLSKLATTTIRLPLPENVPFVPYAKPLYASAPSGENITVTLGPYTISEQMTPGTYFWSAEVYDALCPRCGIVTSDYKRIIIK